MGSSFFGLVSLVFLFSFNLLSFADTLQGNPANSQIHQSIQKFPNQNIQTIQNQTINFNPDIIVPVVASAKGGFGSDWRSDLWIYNADIMKKAVLDLFFVQQGQSVNPSEPTAEITVEPGHTLYLEDIVLNTFHTQGAGALFITLPTEDKNGTAITNVHPHRIVVESNVYNKVDDIKQYGQQLPGIHKDEIAPATESYDLPGSLHPEMYWFNGKWTKFIFENSYYIT